MLQLRTRKPFLDEGLTFSLAEMRRSPQRSPSRS